MLICLVDSAGCVLETNAFPPESVREAEPAVVGKPVEEISWWDDPTAARVKLETAIPRAWEGEVVQCVLPVRVGQTPPALRGVTLTPLRDTDGRVHHVVLVVERPAAVPPLAVDISVEEKFRLFVAGIQDYAMFLLDAQGRISSWNQGAERAKGYRAGEILGSHVSLFYTPEDRSDGKPERLLKEAAELGQTKDEGWRLKKNGTRYWANIQLTALRNPDGSLRGFAQVSCDMTERRKLADARDEALRANGAKSAFLANMSHELRTPLNAVIGYAEMVEEELRDTSLAELADDVARIRSSGKHLLSIISDVLDLSRIEAGRLDLEPEPIDVEALIREVVDSTRPLALQNGNVVQIAEFEKPVTALADRIRLRQVLYNLFANAAKYTRNGRIILSARTLPAPDAAVEIEVADTGIGMTADQLSRLYDKFYQVDHHRTNAQGSTGLGLPICRLLTEAMGGRITVSSLPGEGSTFTLRLPAPQQSGM